VNQPVPPSGSAPARVGRRARHAWHGLVSRLSAKPQVQNLKQPAPEALLPATVTTCQERRQGDVVQVPYLPIEGPGGSTFHRATPEGAVLLSQTCDIVLPDRLTVVAAPLVRLSGDTLKQAQRGTRPRYVSVPAFGGDAFADLDVIGTLYKDVLSDASATQGVGPDDMAVRNFARRVARRFGRFAFPDEVVPWFAPLSDIVIDKYGKSTTGEAFAFAQLIELRVEATGGWISPPYALTLVVIVPAGTLPELEEDDTITPTPELRKWLRKSDGGLRRTSGEIANRLFAHRLDSSEKIPHPVPEPIERYHLWLALAEAWADRCKPRGQDRNVPAVAAAVDGGAVGVELLSDDEYSLARYRRSEQLDLDHLSPPTPR
jgi:hypothetical protein